MLHKVLSKNVGARHEVSLDTESFVVTVSSKKKKQSFAFDKYFKAVNFYARIKQVKDIKCLEHLACQYQCL